MKRIFLLISLIIPACGMMWAQSQGHQHQRTAEECAMKQTQMMIRELNISDSLQYRALYDMNLKYARLREKGCTRAQMMTNMLKRNEELKQILTKEQYEAYMNRQIQAGPHHHQHPVGRFAGQGKANQQAHRPHKGHLQCPQGNEHQDKPGYNN